MIHEEEKVLFRNQDSIITYGDIVEKLKEIGADQCDVLFVHSDISFGLPEKGLKRKELNQLLLDAILEMKNETLIFPTFTFSFCNNEEFDIQNSPTTMGMLPEYVRKTGLGHRTDDPILSCVILGNKTGFEKMNGDSSCGKGGIFHQLRTCGKKVKFLFFGTRAAKCFTYMHYIEEIMQVPYRYARDFSGTVISDNEPCDKTISLYVRYKDVGATQPSDFISGMKTLGFMKEVTLGSSLLQIIDESDSYDYIVNYIKKDPYTFATMPSYEGLKKEYKYGNVKSM